MNGAGANHGAAVVRAGDLYQLCAHRMCPLYMRRKVLAVYNEKHKKEVANNDAFWLCFIQRRTRAQ